MDNQTYETLEELKTEETISEALKKLVDDKSFRHALVGETKKQIIEYLISNPNINITFIPDDIEREIYDVLLSVLIKFLE